MLTFEAKAGATFSYAGTISNLAGTVAWGISAAVRVANAAAQLDVFVCTIAQDPEFATNGLYTVSLSATAEQTLAWYVAAKAQRGELVFDVKLFNTAAADPVLYTDTVKLKLWAPVTA